MLTANDEDADAACALAVDHRIREVAQRIGATKIVNKRPEPWALDKQGRDALELVEEAVL